MTSTFKYPAISNEGGLSVYLDQIKKFPMLDAEEEYMLAKNWKTTGNVKSAEKLVTSHLKIAHQEELDQRKDLLQDSIKILNDREKEILYARRLNENPSTLEDLSKKYKISRERIRQIENKAFEKLQKHMLNSAKSKNLLPVN